MPGIVLQVPFSFEPLSFETVDRGPYICPVSAPHKKKKKFLFRIQFAPFLRRKRCRVSATTTTIKVPYFNLHHCSAEVSKSKSSKRLRNFVAISPRVSLRLTTKPIPVFIFETLERACMQCDPEAVYNYITVANSKGNKSTF